MLDFVGPDSLHCRAGVAGNFSVTNEQLLLTNTLSSNTLAWLCTKKKGQILLGGKTLLLLPRNGAATHTAALRRPPEPIAAHTRPQCTTPPSTLHHRLPDHGDLEAPGCGPSHVGSTARRLLPAAPRSLQGGVGRRRPLRRAGPGREGLVGVATVPGHQATLFGRGCREQAGSLAAVVPQLVDGAQAVQPAGREGCTGPASAYQCVSRISRIAHRQNTS